MLTFKTKSDTIPSKLASAIAHNIENSDIEILSLGDGALSKTVKGLVIAKEFIKNAPFKLEFDFFTLTETDDEGKDIVTIKTVVSKK